MYTLEEDVTSPLRITHMLMPQIIPLLTLILVCTLYEESTLPGVKPLGFGQCVSHIYD